LQGEFAEILLTHLGVESNDDIDPDKLSIIQDLEEVIGAEMVQRRSSVNRESLARILQRFPSKVRGLFYDRWFPFSSNFNGVNFMKKG